MPSWWVDKFIEIYAIITAARHFGYKRGTLSGLTSLRGVAKTFYDRGGQDYRIISLGKCLLPVQESG
jgi:hypothetical protein